MSPRSVLSNPAWRDGAIPAPPPPIPSAQEDTSSNFFTTPCAGANLKNAYSVRSKTERRFCARFTWACIANPPPSTIFPPALPKGEEIADVKGSNTMYQRSSRSRLPPSCPDSSPANGKGGGSSKARSRRSGVCRLSFHASSRCRTNGTSSTSRFRRKRRMLPLLPLPLLVPMLPLLLLLLWLRWGGRVGVKVSSSPSR